MKIEKIDENKLKVTLPISYFVEKNISIEQISQNGPEVQEFFCDLMETVEKEYGFSFTNSIIKVEASISALDTSREIVLILTRTSKETSDMSLVDRYIKRKLDRQADATVEPLESNKAKNNITALDFGENSTDTLICEFDNFDTLCNLAKLANNFYMDYNSLYSLNSKYYLVFKRGNLRTATSIFHEFGEFLPNPAFVEGYLNEYGRLLIFGNALENLAKIQ